MCVGFYFHQLFLLAGNQGREEECFSSSCCCLDVNRCAFCGFVSSVDDDANGGDGDDDDDDNVDGTLESDEKQKRRR